MCISISKSKSCYVYCHLGNVRHVDKVAPDNRGHEIVQVNNYYPYGSMRADGNRGQEVQTHKYNGKEFDTMHGLNLYDYSARQYDATLGQFTSLDPLCEKYYHISPYVYCAGNPVKYVDSDGRAVKIAYVDKHGRNQTFTFRDTGQKGIVRVPKSQGGFVKNLCRHIIIIKIIIPRALAKMQKQV